MHYLVVLLVLNCTLAFTQVAPSKFVSAEGQIAIFLEETPEGLSGTLETALSTKYEGWDVRVEDERVFESGTGL